MKMTTSAPPASKTDGLRILDELEEYDMSSQDGSDVVDSHDPLTQSYVGKRLEEYRAATLDSIAGQLRLTQEVGAFATTMTELVATKRYDKASRSTGDLSMGDLSGSASDMNKTTSLQNKLDSTFAALHSSTLSTSKDLRSIVAKYDRR